MTGGVTIMRPRRERSSGPRVAVEPTVQPTKMGKIELNIEAVPWGQGGERGRWGERGGKQVSRQVHREREEREEGSEGEGERGGKE